MLTDWHDSVGMDNAHVAGVCCAFAGTSFWCACGGCNSGPNALIRLRNLLCAFAGSLCVSCQEHMHVRGSTVASADSSAHGRADEYQACRSTC